MDNKTKEIEFLGYDDFEKIEELEFHKLPITIYKLLNPYEIIVFTFLLNRWKLSRFKNWVDENNNVYLLGAIKSLSDEMGIDRKTLISVLNRLEKKEYIKVTRKRARGNVYYLTDKILKAIKNETEK